MHDCARRSAHAQALPREHPPVGGRDISWWSIRARTTTRVTSRSSTEARVYEFPWCDDFSAARNESLWHAQGEWLFWMDADDSIDETNGRALRQLAAGPHEPQVLAYVVKVRCPGAQVRRRARVCRGRPRRSCRDAIPRCGLSSASTSSCCQQFTVWEGLSDGPTCLWCIRERTPRPKVDVRNACGTCGSSRRNCRIGPTILSRYSIWG